MPTTNREDIKQEIIALVQQGYGRPTILRMVPGATEWQIRTVQGEFKNDQSVPGTDPAVGGATNIQVVASLSPIVVKVPKVSTKRGKKSKLTTMVCVGDTHGQFVDQKALDISCQIIQDVNPDILAHLGDLGDFYSLSRFDKNPARRTLLQDDLEAASRLLGIYDQTVTPDTRKLLFEGNHEDRMQRYIWHNAQALAGMENLKMENLLGVKELGWEYHTHDLEVMPEFLVKHGNMIHLHSGYTAKGELERAWMSGISGHSHRHALHAFTSRRNFLRGMRPAIWIENASLCAPDQEYLKGNGNWQQGFTIIRFDSDSAPLPEFIHISNGKAYYNGKLYSG